VRLSRIGFTAQRSDPESTVWNITQTSGADMFDWNNWGVFDAQDTGNNNKQYGMTEQYTGKLDLKRVMNWHIPTVLQAGVAENVTFKHRWSSESMIARYIGPTGNALTSRLPLSQAQFLIDQDLAGASRRCPWSTNTSSTTSGSPSPDISPSPRPISRRS